MDESPAKLHIRTGCCTDVSAIIPLNLYFCCRFECVCRSQFVKIKYGFFLHLQHSVIIVLSLHFVVKIMKLPAVGRGGGTPDSETAFLSETCEHSPCRESSTSAAVCLVCFVCLDRK